MNDKELEQIPAEVFDAHPDRARPSGVGERLQLARNYLASEMDLIATMPLDSFDRGRLMAYLSIAIDATYSAVHILGMRQ